MALTNQSKPKEGEEKLMVTVTSKQFKHCDLVTVVGRIDSASAPLLQEGLREIMKAGRYHIVVDLDGIELLSSTGLAMLIAAGTECRRYNRGDIRLFMRKVYKPLEFAGFADFFRIFDNLAEAVGSF